MKKILLTAIALWICTFVFAQGVNFQDVTFKEALEKAKKENKFVFMDCYTSWCGPCKRMVAEVFSQEQVGKYFNEKFISVKYDMEKGEGVDLRNRYGVGLYPTFLILDTQGKVCYKFIGFCPSEDLLKHAEKGTSSVSDYAEMEARYQTGERDKMFLKGFLHRMKEYNDPRMPEVAAELSKILTEEEKVSPEYWYLYSSRETAPRNSDNFKYLLEHCDKFHQIVGEKIHGVVYNAYMPTLLQITGVRRKKDTTSLETLNQMEKEVKLWPEYIEKTTILLEIAICQAVKKNDMDELIAVCDNGFRTYDEAFMVFRIGAVSGILAEEGAIKQKETWADLCEKYASKVEQGISRETINLNVDRMRKQCEAHRALEKNGIVEFIKKCDKQFDKYEETKIVFSIQAFSTIIGQKGTKEQKDAWSEFCEKCVDKVGGAANKKAIGSCINWLKRF